MRGTIQEHWRGRPFKRRPPRKGHRLQRGYFRPLGRDAVVFNGGGKVERVIVDVSGETYADLEIEAIGAMKRD
jgi:hypothetical protein